MNYADYTDYAKTDKQKEYLKLIIMHGSANNAAKQSGISRDKLKNAWASIKKNAAKHGFAPNNGMIAPAADGFQTGKVTRQVNAKGELIQAWYKDSQEADSMIEIMQQAVQAFKEDIPVYKPSKIHKVGMQNADILNCYVIADYHLGMVANELTTGDEDWNTKKAEEVLYRWFETAIEAAPPAEKCLLMEMGDFMHIDNQKGLTEASGNVLEYDVPINVLIRIAIKVMRKVVNLLLSKYSEVNLMIVDGNHNLNGANWMQELLISHYEEESRIQINDNKTPYYCFEFGEVSLFAHHGHIKKPTDCEEVFINRYRDVFGRTKKSYAHLGHRHHKHVIEKSNMIIEQHPTLAAKDKHAADNGYSSDRSANVITYHKKHGEVSRITINRDMI